MEANNSNSPRIKRRQTKSSPATNQTNAVLKPNANRRNAGSNWNNVGKGIKVNDGEPENKMVVAQQMPNSMQKRAKIPASDKFVAMDCEMVGTGLHGKGDMLARVSIVNRNGKVLLDKYVKPRSDITDYRTAVSGIRPSSLVNAEEFDTVQREVQQLLQNRMLVGHNVRKDLQVLNITHPYGKIRDTSSYKPLSNLVSNGRTPSLKRLSEVILGISIQTGEHNSVEDARAAMGIYNRLGADWEQHIKHHSSTKRKW